MKKMINMKKILRIFVLLCALWAGFIPTRAEAVPVTCVSCVVTAVANTAKELAEWAKQITWLTDIFSTLTSMYNGLTQWFDDLQDHMDMGTAALVHTQITDTQYAVKLAQKEIDANWMTRQVGDVSILAAKQSPAPRVDESICRTVRAQQLHRNLQYAADDLANNILKGAEDEARWTGNGPGYTRTVAESRCGSAFGVNGPGFMDKRDAKDPKCAPASGPYEALLTNADISATTLTPSMNNPPLDEPKGVYDKDLMGNTYKPEATNVGEALFIAGRDYCLNMAGPAPKPVTGNENSTSEGATNKAIMASCAPARSAFLNICAKRLAYLTRRNPTQSEAVKNMIKESAKACEAEKTQKESVLPSNYDCNKGLSPYQAEYINVVRCQKTEAYGIARSGGRLGADQMKDTQQCQMLFTQWQSKMETMEQNFLMAAAGLQNNDCLRQVKR